MLDAAIKMVFAEQNPSLTKINAAMEAAAANNPALAEKVAGFQNMLKDTAMGRMEDIQALDKVLSADPALYKRVHDLAVTDPSLLQTLVPDALDNSASLQKILDKAAPLSPAETQLSAENAAPEPLSTLADNSQAEQGTEEPQNNPSDKLASIDGKMEELAKIPGFIELGVLVKKDPNMSRMFQSMMGEGEGDPKKVDAFLDELLERAGKTPEERQESQIFVNLRDFMREKPGQASTIAGFFSDNPKMGMTAIAGYSAISQSFGQIFDKLLGPGVFDSLVMKLMGFIAPALAKSQNILGLSNNGGTLLDDALKGMGMNVTQTRSDVDPATGAVTPRQPNQAAVAANPETSPEKRKQTPGMAPGMDIAPV